MFTRRCTHIMTSAHTLLSGHCIIRLLYDVSDMSVHRLCRPASSSRRAHRSSHTHPRGWRDSMSSSGGCRCRMSSTSTSDSFAMQTPSPGFATSSASRCRRSCIRPCVPHRAALCVHDRHMSHTFLCVFGSTSVVTCVCDYINIYRRSRTMTAPPRSSCHRRRAPTTPCLTG